MIISIQRILASLLTDVPNPEFDVNGVTDPFLQVTALKLIRILGKGCQTTSTTASDILQQVPNIFFEFFYKFFSCFRFLKRRILPRMQAQL